MQSNNEIQKFSTFKLEGPDGQTVDVRIMATGDIVVNEIPIKNTSGNKHSLFEAAELAASQLGNTVDPARLAWQMLLEFERLWRRNAIAREQGAK